MSPPRSSSWGGARTAYGSPNPPSGQLRCRIWWDADVQGYQISCPYNPQFYEALKKLIPGSGGVDRTYDPQTKQWFISERFFEPTRKLAQAIWPNPGECLITDRATHERNYGASTAPQRVNAQTIEQTCKQFMEVIPLEAAQAAYRAAARVLHSDVAGEAHGDKMAQLNVLWDKIKKELYKQ